jgi:CheY-like chemotaxis protein
MIVSCPECKKKFNFDPKDRSGDVRLKCSACGSVFTVSAGAGKGTDEVPESGVKILVAADDDEIMDAIETMLKGRDIRLIKSRDGNEVVEIAQSLKPTAVVLDVALPGLYSFSICEKIKNTPALKDIKVMLLSEAFNQKRYRRKPTSLFGADDFVEKHDISAEFLPKMWKLLGSEPPKKASAPPKPASAPASAFAAPAPQRPRPAEPVKAVVNAPAAPINSELHEKSKRLARVIAADIILYNKEKLDSSANKADIGELFKNDIAEGIKYFKQRLPQAADAAGYLDEAIREFLTGRRKGALLKA